MAQKAKKKRKPVQHRVKADSPAGRAFLRARAREKAFAAAKKANPNLTVKEFVRKTAKKKKKK